MGDPEIRNFMGSLDAHGATLGVFVTTSDFQPAAVKSAKSYCHGKIVLIDGIKLTELMLTYGVVMDAPYGSEILPMSQFDANKPEKGVYMDSPDSFIEVLPCATSVDDRATTRITGFEFQKVDSESDSGSSDFAHVIFGVMRDGTINIPSASVDGYTQDGGGNWVQKRK